MVGRKVDWRYPVLAVVATALIFSGIFYFGINLNEYKVDTLQNQIETVEVEQNSRLVGQELSESMDQDSCRAMGEWMNATVDDLNDLRQEVASYENSRKMDSKEYMTVKKQYMNLLLQNLAQVRKYERNCDRKMIDIIYFYSDGCDACPDQGTVLTHLKQQHGSNVVVYPLDTELGMHPISFLENYYEVERYPTLVVEGEVKEGFQSMEELENAIDDNLNNTEEG